MDQPTNGREYSKEEIEDIKKSRAFKAMMNTEGWKMYEAMLSSRFEEFSQELLAPPSMTSHDMSPLPDGAKEALNTFWIKGAMSQILWARNIPSVTIAAMEDLSPPAEEE